MDNIARSVLNNKIDSLKATYFQDSLDKIFLTIYGDDFTRIKQKQDKGSDGILNGDTIIAAYAPEKYTLADFKKKVGADYESYKKNWKSTHPEWLVVCNLEMTSSMKKFVNSLKPDSKTMCIESLIELIRTQTWTKKKMIFQSLDMPDTYLSNDLLSVVIDDILNISDSVKTIQPYEKPLYIEDKVKLNLKSDQVDLFLDEYEEYLTLFSSIKAVVKDHDPNSVQALRSKIRVTYLGLSGDFSNKIQIMCETLCGVKINDDIYCYHMRAVVVYFFEQCLFGIKTPAEAV